MDRKARNWMAVGVVVVLLGMMAACDTTISAPPQCAFVRVDTNTVISPGDSVKIENECGSGIFNRLDLKVYHPVD